MIFIDTGAWIERDLEGREHKDLAERGWSEILHGGLRAVTSDLVVSELATFTKRAGAPEAGAEFATDVLASKVIELVAIAADDRRLALRFFRKYRDQPGITWCDCVSFAIMKRLKIRRAFAFDGDFDLAGFEFWPERAFSPRRRKKAGG